MPKIDLPTVETEDINVPINYEQLADELRIENNNLKEAVNKLTESRLALLEENNKNKIIMEALADTINLIDLQVSMLKKTLNNIN